MTEAARFASTSLRWKSQEELEQLDGWEDRANTQSLGVKGIEVFEELGPFFATPVPVREAIGTHEGSSSYIEALEEAAAAQGIQKVHAMGSITDLMTDPVLSGKEAFDIVLEKAVEGFPIRLLGAFRFRANARPLVKVPSVPKYENHLGHVSVWIGSMDREGLIQHILEKSKNDEPQPSKFDREIGMRCEHEHMITPIFESDDFERELSGVKGGVDLDARIAGDIAVQTAIKPVRCAVLCYDVKYDPTRSFQTSADPEFPQDPCYSFKGPDTLAKRPKMRFLGHYPYERQQRGKTPRRKK